MLPDNVLHLIGGVSDVGTPDTETTLAVYGLNPGLKGRVFSLGLV